VRSEAANKSAIRAQLKAAIQAPCDLKTRGRPAKQLKKQLTTFNCPNNLPQAFAFLAGFGYQ